MTISVSGATSSGSALGASPVEAVGASSVGWITGEFRCCSSSYSLIKRFFNEWALLEADGVVGEECHSLPVLWAMDFLMLMIDYYLLTETTLVEHHWKQESSR